MSSPLAAIPFVKASACGNDFLIIEDAHAKGQHSAISRRLCHRHNGVGADGVEWLSPSSDADIRARLFNADGSEAEISGNGTRCVAVYLAVQLDHQNFKIETGAGCVACKRIARSGHYFEFEIAMGTPEVDPELSLDLGSRVVRGIPVSMGNPHFVIFVDQFASNWQTLAAEIGRHPHFKHGVNVELVLVENKSTISIRLFERGVGETQSSGTGSCASAVAAIATGRAVSPVTVTAPGGSQTVRWDGEVFLTGSTQLICQGEFFI